jgi:hypothetical protein
MEQNKPEQYYSGVIPPTQLQEQKPVFMQEGGTIDPVSGNEVPVGAMQEEVRDDIPAMLSEGEFVFPADVVRFIGLERLMKLRQEAKEGLAKMEAMGQMGNADEATEDDDGQFETDIDGIMAEVESEGRGSSEQVEMAEGGMPMPQGMDMQAPAAAPAPTADQQTDQMMQPTQAMRPSMIIQEALAKDGSTEEDKEQFRKIVNDVATNRAFMVQQNNTVFVGATDKPGSVALFTYSVDEPDAYQDAVTKFLSNLTEAKITKVNPKMSSPEVVTALRSAGAEGLLTEA